ncbi:hypothetical protein SDC9_80386 [bioreactor metagenome]|uniref:Uncharacterized protein n=1 Tax=bioreactor metagenome TaxID=1076179 RepID=A0A644YZL5_9ZZZZ|nr:hypothetical protein [Candidatus Metalachnospira sp.]
MEIIEYFFECYFNMSANYIELEDLVNEFIQIESNKYINSFKKALTDIIDNENWDIVIEIASSKGGRLLKPKKAEMLVRYLKFLIDGNKPIEKPNFYFRE